MASIPYNHKEKKRKTKKAEIRPSSPPFGLELLRGAKFSTRQIESHKQEFVVVTATRDAWHAWAIGRSTSLDFLK